MLYQSLLRPLLFRLPPETAHDLAISLLRSPLAAPSLQFALRAYHKNLADNRFAVELFGRRFSNPIGLAAGFDKNGVGVRALAAAGFGFVEVGTVTSLAQTGNPSPRLFRLPQERALINRLGFNNRGAKALARTLASTVGVAEDRKLPCVLGINIGKSRVTPNDEAVDDYLKSFDLVSPYADYVAINVSSPNTPDLRELQQADALYELLNALQKRNVEIAASNSRQPVPLLVKIAPDLSLNELEMIVDVAKRARISGIIATNTTVDRSQLGSAKLDAEKFGAGGISGAPLRAISTEIIARIFQLARSELMIIGVGGIFNAEDAWEKITAGASLVQIYTGFIYQGFGILPRINEELYSFTRQHGFRSLDEAVGYRARELSNLFATTR